MTGLDTSVLVAAAIGDHSSNKSVWIWMNEALDRGETFAITSGILAEFIHVVTDQRRFENPLSMTEALEWSRYWCDAQEVTLLNADEHVNARWLHWIGEFRLGRKRLLDTLIAAIWMENGVTNIFTLNPADFTVFGEFHIHGIEPRD